MQRLNKVCINSVFVHGYFSIKSPCKLDKQNESTDLIAGNRLDVYFNVRSFTLKLTKHISYFVHQQNLHKVIQDHLQKLTPWKIVSTTAKITNFQGTITISNCSSQIFNGYILRFLINGLKVENIGLADENDATTTVHLKPERFFELLENGEGRGYSYLTLNLGAEQKLKIQPSKRKDNIQISFVFTRYSKNLQRALKTLQKLAVFFDNQQTKISTKRFLRTQLSKCQKKG